MSITRYYEFRQLALLTNFPLAHTITVTITTRIHRTRAHLRRTILLHEDIAFFNPSPIIHQSRVSIMLHRRPASSISMDLDDIRSRNRNRNRNVGSTSTFTPALDAQTSWRSLGDVRPGVSLVLEGEFSRWLSQDPSVFTDVSLFVRLLGRILTGTTWAAADVHSADGSGQG